jgi:hypothetical protein
MARLWNDYNAYWHEVANQGKIPVFFFRFEDLLHDPQTVLNSALAFMLGVPTLEGTYLEKRISDTLAKGKEEAGTLYKPRAGGVGKSSSMFTDEQKAIVAKICGRYIKFLGYDDPSLGLFKESQEYMGEAAAVSHFTETVKAQMKLSVEKGKDIEPIEIGNLCENAP